MEKQTNSSPKQKQAFPQSANQKKKKPQPMKKVSKPFLKGKIWDKTSWRSSLTVFLGQLGMMLAFLFLGSMLMWGSTVVSVIINSIMYLLVLTVFYQVGVNKGTSAVNLGEILYQQNEKGGKVKKEEHDQCYNAAKGFLMGLAGCVPYMIAAIFLAATTAVITTGIGALPSWVSGLQHREEFADAVAFYSVTTALNATDIVRVLVRLLLMPFVNIIGASNSTGLLMLEKLSPVLVLLPGIAFGVGYTGGKGIRTMVHSEIAAGTEKRQRKERKERKKRMANTPKGPQSLN